MEMLNVLEVLGDGIINLAPLKDCSNLKDISVSSAKFYNDLDCVSRGSALKKLSLSSVPISDLGILRQVPGLEELNLTALPLSNYEFADALHNLTTLVINYIWIEAAFPWSSTASLKRLTLRHPAVRLLDGLREKIGLEDLVVQSLPTGNLSWVPDQIKSLEIWRDGRSLNIEDISRLEELSDVDFSQCVIQGAVSLTRPAKGRVLCMQR